MNSYQCINDIINVDERKQLLSQAMNCNYHNYKTYKGTHTGLQVVSTGDEKLPLDGLVKELVSRVNPNLKFFIAVFMKFAPNDGTGIGSNNYGIHKDDHLGRTSCITWALYPELKDFSPVKYYNEDETFNEAVYYKEKPLIITTRNNHSVDNKSEKARYTFQICFYDSIEKLAELDQKGELFI
jgi:hypothetical protein